MKVFRLASVGSSSHRRYRALHTSPEDRRSGRSLTPAAADKRDAADRVMTLPAVVAET